MSRIVASGSLEIGLKVLTEAKVVISNIDINVVAIKIRICPLLRFSLIIHPLIRVSDRMWLCRRPASVTILTV